MLLGRMDWNFMQMSATAKHPNCISMAWTPEKGLLNHGWSGYNEGLFLYVLAAGTGMKDVEKSYDSWLSTYEWKTPYKGLSHVAFPPLFGHQFSQAFIDYRGLADKYMKEKGIDYFENSRRATYVQRAVCHRKSQRMGWLRFALLGCYCHVTDLAAQYNFGDKKFEGYAGRGSQWTR